MHEHTLCSLFLVSLVLALDIDCNSPPSLYHQEYCTTRQLADLYDRKLKILEHILSTTSNFTHPPASIQSPYSQNLSLYVRSNTFKGETVFVPPDKVINQGSFY